jgi:polysaccharide pyruvyl transferase WcaK-like protein
VVSTDAVSPPGLRSFQICNGQGAGNIGDELMNRAFWDALPPSVELEVEVFPNATLQGEPYPPRHRYVTIDWEGRPAPSPTVPGLLVGDTPVTDTLGPAWPLRFLAPRLDAFHAAGLPVDALGIGVEPLRSDEGRALFAASFRQVRSWTVRSERCRLSLLELGVDPARVAVGCDWAWLYRARRDRSAWAGEVLRGAGWDGRAPLVLANVVNEIWAANAEAKRALARALDRVAARGAAVAFFCQEMRPGAFFDQAAAAEMRASMTQPSLLVPPQYYTPDEALALVSFASVTLSSRYHFTVQSVLAGVVPVTLARSPKMTGLLDELGLAPVSTLDQVDEAAVLRALEGTLDTDAGPRPRLAAVRDRLAARAARNLDLWLPAAQDALAR